MRMKMGLVIAFIAALVIPAAFLYATRNNEATDVSEGSVFGRDATIKYILENYPELSGLGDPSKIRMPWQVDNLTPEGWAGSYTVQFTKGGWSIRVSNAVVLMPVYSVEVEFTGDGAFCWKGTVDQAGNVSVIEFSQ